MELRLSELKRKHHGTNATIECQDDDNSWITIEGVLYEAIGVGCDRVIRWYLYHNDSGFDGGWGTKRHKGELYEFGWALTQLDEYDGDCRNLKIRKMMCGVKYIKRHKMI